MLTSLRLAGFTSMVLLVGAASPSQAQAPTYAAQLTEAQATLSRATAEKDPARQPDVWLHAARQFSAMVPRKDISDGQRLIFPHGIGDDAATGKVDAECFFTLENINSDRCDH